MLTEGTFSKVLGLYLCGAAWYHDACCTTIYHSVLTNYLILLYHFDQSFTSHITRPHELNQFGFRHASQEPVNILKIGIAGIKKNLGTLHQLYEQFGQKIHSVMHHHWSWTSVSVNYVCHASQDVNDRSKWYSTLGWWLSLSHLQSHVLFSDPK